ncbi:MAG TPA: hypothetical protein VLB09_08135, partial [Nitrospiria bacterium]|nr:hypothetical protein [Nitrospiria bacterium]
SVGGPVQSLYGYLVYRVEEKKLSQQLPFEKLNKKLLEKEMRESEVQKRLKEWIEGLREKADIKFLEPSP